MNRFIGTKIILAKPMTREVYNKYRGWELPKDESGSDAGYLVEYTDSPNSNHPQHNGYISWSPRAVFDAAYRQTDNMSFGLAIEAAKKGLKIARAGWNGKNMFVFIRQGRQITGVATDTAMGGDFESLSHFCMRTADGKCCVGWLASQTDMLADDWEILGW